MVFCEKFSCCSTNQLPLLRQSVLFSFNQISNSSNRLSSVFSLKSYKHFLKCNPCIATAYKMFPLRHLLYIFPFKSLFMEPTATISFTESAYGPPDPSIILLSDEKNDISF